MVKAKLSAKEGRYQGQSIDCLFNPKELSLSKQNSWNEGRNAGGNMGNLQFSKGQAASLTVDLFFDTYHSAESEGQAKDVRKEYTDKILRLMMVDPDLHEEQRAGNRSNKKRPPHVTFQWGSFNFEGVITNLKQQFTLFSSEGVPMRATVNLTLQQASDPAQLPWQNPTSGGLGGERLWTVQHGDTLSLIAYRNYGDAALWRPIADANQLTQTRTLKAGQMLLIPTL